jgi:hypothetical protein
MKLKFTGLLLAMLLVGFPQSRPQPQPVSILAEIQTLTQTQEPSALALPVPSGLIVKVSAFQGKDLGARINKADQALGVKEGWVLVDMVAPISTAIRLSDGHKLKFSKGTYSLDGFAKDDFPILMGNNTAIYGSGIDKTVFLEPPTGYVVIGQAGLLEREKGYDWVGIRSNLRLAGFTVKGRNMTPEGGARSTIQLGNAHDVHVWSVKLQDTTCLGITAGGDGLTGKFAENILVEDCIFEGVASQNLNVVNGQKVIFRRNKFFRTGKLCAGGTGCEGAVSIDVEPNHSSDVARDILIEDILIDSSQSPFMHGNGIMIQNGAGANFGNVTLRRLTIIGGPLTSNDSLIASGIYLAMVNDVKVSDSYVQRVAHSGFRVENSKNITVERVKLVSTGTGGILSFEVYNTTDSRFAFNSVTVDPRSPLGRGLMLETHGSNRNVFEGNVVSENVYIIGKESRVIPK